jgi:hypothetical protein
LEVSLRTNRIDWVHKFLDPPLNGLDILIEYLKNSLNFMRETDKFFNFDSLNETLQLNGMGPNNSGTNGSLNPSSMFNMNQNGLSHTNGGSLASQNMNNSEFTWYYSNESPF